jgi:hypothetical protein
MFVRFKQILGTLVMILNQIESSPSRKRKLP